jgi:hypothetical protein
MPILTKFYIAILGWDRSIIRKEEYIPSNVVGGIHPTTQHNTRVRWELEMSCWEAKLLGPEGFERWYLSIYIHKGEPSDG